MKAITSNSGVGLYAVVLSRAVEQFSVLPDGSTDDLIEGDTPQVEYLLAYRCDCGKRFEIGKSGDEDGYEDARAAAWTTAQGHLIEHEPINEEQEDATIFH